MRRGSRVSLAVLFATALLLGGCGERMPQARRVRVVLEESSAYTAEVYALEGEAGSSFSFLLHPADGCSVAGCDVPNAYWQEEMAGTRLVLPEVSYSRQVHVDVEESGLAICYHRNDGSGETVSVSVRRTHLRVNTEAAGGRFIRPGYTLAGWNTKPDGSGTEVLPGSRVSPEEAHDLYAQWEAWNPEEDFVFEDYGEGTAITGCTAPSREKLVIPASLSGKPVLCIRDGAFAGAEAGSVVLPESLEVLEDGAFAGAALTELTLCDTLEKIGGYAFADCEELSTLRIAAAKAPVYAGTYYATFPDKMDHLREGAKEQKIILFSGSSTRFGYDSPLLEEHFPGYRVFNMGVFAYTNALPQFDLIRQFAGPGDILIHTPEFDAAKRQFCTTNRMDAAFFRLVEEDYALISLLDLRDYTGVFQALQEFLAGRQGMEGRSYELSPADFDEDGMSAPAKTYNEAGDYVLHRENAADDAPVYGLPVAYTKEAFPRSFLESVNAVYESFLEKGVRVFFAYAPRNALAVSEETNDASLEELDAWFAEGLIVPVLGKAKDSLVPGRLLYGTDNHLSTEGARLRTLETAQLLQQALEAGNPASADES